MLLKHELVSDEIKEEIKRYPETKKSWTMKKAERRRMDPFELWCWRKLLRVPWSAKRSHQTILKISPGCTLEGLMLKLKF